MLDLVQVQTQFLGHGFFAIAAENMIEMGVHRGRQRAVVPGPEFFHAGGARFGG